MEKKKGSSYLDQLSAGHESDTVKNYDPAIEEGQIGLAHEQEVAPANNWGGDQRDAIGRAASVKKIIARKLRRIANELEALEYMSNEYSDEIEKAKEQIQEELKVARHPLENPDHSTRADQDSQTGDNEWIDIGPGIFRGTPANARDTVGRAA